MNGSIRERIRPTKPGTPLELATLAVAAARLKKAQDLTLLEVAKQTGYTDYLVLASGRSTRQASAIAENVERVLRKAGRRPIGSEGAREGRWVLLDYGEVIVHVFHEPVREFYNLEALWGDAERVELSHAELDAILPIQPAVPRFGAGRTPLTRPKPVALIILDGWGISPSEYGNAVAGADMPFVDSLFTAYPHGRLACSGRAVGLPEGQMGNSEVGHLNLGAGRVVWQDTTRIGRAIEDGSFFDNPALSRAMDRVKENGSTLHLLGLLGPGGVHGLDEHLHALVEMADKKGLAKVRVHSFLDGRDTPPDSGLGFMQSLLDFLADHPQTKVATVGGRYWGMDRDSRWDRVKKAWDCLVKGQGPTAMDPVAAIKASYDMGTKDEFLEPTILLDEAGQPLGVIGDGDAVIFYNFRADRGRELTWAFNQAGFDGFETDARPALADYVTMTRFDDALDLPTAFPPQRPAHTLAETISRAGLKQLHIAETEKYAHVTYFLNGGEEEPFTGEDRVLVPSPADVATYDQKPAMSAWEVTDEVLARLEGGSYDFIVINYANGDMVGHTGVYEAAREAMETVDQCLARLVPAILAVGGAVLLTADHGNAEQMIDPATDGPYTAHTVFNPVPVLLIDPSRRDSELDEGALCDVAPTLLAILGLNPPKEMTGKCLLK